MDMTQSGRAIGALLFFVSSFTLFTACDTKEPAHKSETIKVARIEPLVIRTLPHDTSAFTQGLLIHNNQIYESTGLYGESSLRCLNMQTGEVIKSKSLDAEFFGEGIAVFDNILIQLTWENQIALLYRLPELTQVDHYEYTGEGWGITFTGSHFIMSNGSSNLYKRDKSFALVKTMTVTRNGRPLSKLNELEYARGKIYANVWYNDFIFEINPATGSVLREIDCSILVQQAQVTNEHHVLNGIAYNKKTDTFYLTGKKWKLMFEVRIPE